MACSVSTQEREVTDIATWVVEQTNAISVHNLNYVSLKLAKGTSVGQVD